jgi:catechol 2,3-dioxygenase-like lactoylglutathione lyase family enzyme
MKPKISMITLGVSDLAAATVFYRDGLELPVYGDFSGVTFFSLSGTWLALYPRKDLAQDARVHDSGRVFGGVTLAHNVGSREEVNDLLLVAEKAGALIMKPAEDTEWGGYSGYFADPDGYLWEIAWNPHFDLT